jgi:CubicO group peptidase (beta-lactamase class C family)
MRLDLFFILFISICSSAHAGIPDNFSSNVQKLLQKNFNEGKFVGLSIAVISPEKNFEFHAGVKDLNTGVSPDKNTTYELASISKTFTRLLLANQNEVLLTDTIDNYLPSHIRAPRPEGQSITIENLITHTGVVFSVPCTYRQGNDNPICFGFDITSIKNPYKNTTREGLYNFLNEYSYTVDEFSFKKPGLFNTYSNMGSSLIGEILAEKNATTYEDLLNKQIFNVLGMNSSYLNPICQPPLRCPDAAKVYYKKELAAKWQETEIWEMSGMAAAGGIKSSLTDMSVYLKANMGLHSSVLDSTIKKGQEYLKTATETANSNICKPGEIPTEVFCNKYPLNFYYAWEGLEPGTIYYHAGATSGSQSMIIFNQERSLGIVILSNSSFRDDNGNSIVHYPNDLSLCLMQMAGKPVADADFCGNL